MMPIAIIEIDNPEHLLVWPIEIAAGEIDRWLRFGSAKGYRGQEWASAVTTVLTAAFSGPALVQEFEAQERSITYQAPVSQAQLRWLSSLRGELGFARRATAPRPLWSKRGGSGRQPLDLGQTVTRFLRLVGSLAQRQSLWTETFGVNCPDGVGDPDEPAHELFLRLLDSSVVGTESWPLDIAASANWTADELFDVMEVLHDMASWPATWSGHNYGGCIGHPGSFSPTCGRALYRHEMNQLLKTSSLGVQMAMHGEDVGRVILHSGGPVDDLIDSASATAPVTHQADIEHAIALFRSRDRDVPSMRSAIVTVAGVLEANRNLLKDELLTGDESALFQIVNTFNLRHRNAEQRTDFDPVFLEWIFHSFLATAGLIGRLQRRATPRDDDRS